MTTSRWRLLTAYLPGIASVVNSFQSPEVQLSVYHDLMKALEDKTEVEDAQMTARSRANARGKSIDRDATVTPASDNELVYDLVEGDSIHSLATRS